MAESNKLPTSKKLSSHFNNPAWNKVHRIFLPHNKKNQKNQVNKKVERNAERTDTEENS